MAILPDYGRIIRGFGSHDNAMVVQPRPSYTFFATFHINPTAPSGNYHTGGVATHKIFASLKSIGKPSLEYEIEKMRAYNTPYLLKKKVTYKDIPVTFFDDSTSFIQGLVKSYRAFYSMAGNKTNGNSELERVPLSATRRATGTRDTTEWTPVDGADPDARMYDGGNQTLTAAGRQYGERIAGLNSLGLRAREEKNFFTKIRIYDLGSEPNSINVYTIFNPVFASVDQTVLDYSTVTLQEVTLNLSYEDFTEEIGVDLNQALSEENFLSPALIGSIKYNYAQRTGNFNGGSTGSGDVAVYDEGDALFAGQEDGSNIQPPSTTDPRETETFFINDLTDAPISTWRDSLTVAAQILPRLRGDDLTDDLLDLADRKPNPTVDV
jgi:hypothetical protein